jgi:predicted nucleotidyltransferase
VDVRGSLFTPAVYIAEDGEAGPMRIVCYDMMLAGVLRSGDVVEVQGKLEVAEAKGGERWLQILVGSYEGVGKEYVRIVG